ACVELELADVAAQGQSRQVEAEVLVRLHAAPLQLPPLVERSAETGKRPFDVEHGSLESAVLGELVAEAPRLGHRHRPVQGDESEQAEAVDLFRAVACKARE